MRIMAIDPGAKRIGLAVSDLSGTIARPLCVLSHQSRQLDVAKIIRLADENQVNCFVMGLSVDEQGNPTPSGRSAQRLADELCKQTNLTIHFWDEGETTRMAKETRLLQGVSKKKRRGHQDDLAAAILLQFYIEHNGVRGEDEKP
jgi:putative Holliday junction resolvase